jgi:hypothetical protein
MEMNQIPITRRITRLVQGPSWPITVEARLTPQVEALLTPAGCGTTHLTASVRIWHMTLALVMRFLCRYQARLRGRAVVSPGGHLSRHTHKYLYGRTWTDLS